jgi:hypothetical protein
VIVSLIVLGLTVLALGLMSLLGRVPERIAVVAILTYLVAVPLLEDLKIGELRLGVAIAEFALFLFLWALAERFSRWWLTAAAGFQLISVLSFAVPLFFDQVFLVWTGVAARLGAWSLVVIALFFAAFEAWARDRASKDTPNGKPYAPI